MTENEERLAKLLGDLPFHDRPDPAHRDGLEQQLLRARARRRERGALSLAMLRGRHVMQNRAARWAIIAAAIVAIVAGLSFVAGWPGAGGAAWAIEQSIAELWEVQTLHISGTTLCGGQPGPFECWLKREGPGGKFAMRYESDCELVVARDGRTHLYSPQRKTVWVAQGLEIGNVAFWSNKIFDLRSWVAGILFRQLKRWAEDWDESYGPDEASGRECVFVTFRYPPMEGSFWLQCDVETKLPLRAKAWHNDRREGAPSLDAEQFVYNEAVPDELFEFEIPQGAAVVEARGWKEMDALRKEAWRLFDDNRLDEAIDAYRQVYEQYPRLPFADSALMMIGLCYREMGQDDKAVEALEKAVSEYADLGSELGASYFYLGDTYLALGRKQEALAAFRKILELGEGVRDPEGFPLKDARRLIAKIEAAN